MKEITEASFLQHIVQNGPRMMWFLGAGTSRTAGMPTALDIIWDLKRKYYCLHENQNLQAHDINNKAIKNKIQSYMDSKGFPALWSAEEYSFYFELTFGKDHLAQQKYIQSILSPDKISLNIGHRVLAALLNMGQPRVVFTTNFDQVLESAYSMVTGKNIDAFHLEGSYAALNALNSEIYPIYAKVHGDFRYQSIKNLSSDLITNNEQIQQCFLAASIRNGLVVSGYSGRDINVMSMIRKALEQNNTFPNGLFWTVTKLTDTAPAVIDLIEQARSKNISAHVVKTGTFDEMMSKIWRQTPNKPDVLDAKVRSARVSVVSIPLPPPGKAFPILRTNALPVTKLPASCAVVDYSSPLTFQAIKDNIFKNKPNAIITFTDKLHFWGTVDEIHKVIEKEKIISIQKFDFEEPIRLVADSTFMKSFFEEALCRSVCYQKPLMLRKKDRTYYAVVKGDQAEADIFMPLRQALAFNGKLASLSSAVPKIADATWSECVSMRLEERNGALWLLLKPDIWVTPLSSRQAAIDFLRKKKLYRWNKQSYEMLDAWIKILLGSVGTGETSKVSCYPGVHYAPTFEINSRTAYSRRVGVHGQ